MLRIPSLNWAGLGRKTLPSGRPDAAYQRRIVPDRDRRPTRHGRDARVGVLIVRKRQAHDAAGNRPQRTSRHTRQRVSTTANHFFWNALLIIN
jgi:hypothetical protein